MAGLNYHKLFFVPGAVLILFTGCNHEQDPVIEETFDRLYTIERGATITIHNDDGAIFVYGSNVNEMQVHAVKKAYRRERLKQIAVDVFTKPDSVSVATRLPPKPKWGFFDRSGTVTYTIVVPATANISELDLDAGEILLDGMRGAMTRVRLGEGRIFARNCFGNLDLAVRRGNVILSFDWWEQSNFSAQVNIAQGNAWAHFPSDAAFHLLANAPHGKIFNDFETVAVAAAPSAGMKIDLPVHGGGEGTINIHVVEGNIKVVEAYR